MKKYLVLALMFVAIPAFADTTTLTEPAVVEEVIEVAPDQQTENVKSYTGVNYNRQDSKKTGKQRISNDHSWFNVNINIIKEGALFQKEDK